LPHSNRKLWPIIRAEAEEATGQDSIMKCFLQHCILERASLADAVAMRLSELLQDSILDKFILLNNFSKALSEIENAESLIEADLSAVYQRDPAAQRYMDALLYYKGFHALQTHRIAHRFWREGRKDFALYLQSRASSVFQVDIHPAARIGKGIFIDHATGVVIGETAILEDDVSLLHEVTLGGTGKEKGNRHPKIRRGVLIGAGAKILGNIEIGACSKVAANSVVLSNVPPHVTVAGVPARIVSRQNTDEPSLEMDQTFICGEGI